MEDSQAVSHLEDNELLDEIAGELGITVMTVKFRLRARLELKHRMEKYGRASMRDYWTKAVLQNSGDPEGDPAGQ